jgi:hypothetical protein
MSEERCFRYWTVECKTPGCGLLVLALIGRSNPGIVQYLRECRDFELTCRKCGRLHLYKYGDVSWKDLEVEPRADFQPDPAFLDAIRPEPHLSE